MASRKLIQSMFLRRLWTLTGLMAVLCLVLAGQTWRLTVVDGADFLRVAEARLVTDEWTPTVRGRILDRKGRVLAQDEASFDILVDYPVITGEAAYTRAARQARRENRDEWPKLGRSDRERLIKARLPDHEVDLRSMWVNLSEALGIHYEELEARRSEIRRTVQRTCNSVWERWLEARREELNRDREIDADISLSDVMRPLAIQREPHAVALGVSEEVGYAVRRIADRYPGIRIAPSGRRTYPYESQTVVLDRSTLPSPMRTSGETSAVIEVDGVATHIVGWMRGLQKDDAQKRPATSPGSGQLDRGVYLEGDLVGADGIEASCETALRGLRGRRVLERDTAATAEEILPSHGQDVSLTIDISLQARVQALMEPAFGLAQLQPWHRSAVESQAQDLEDGTPLFGAAVVLEIDTGEVLAMVSTPSFTRQEFQENSQAIFDDRVRAAWVNKAIAKPYPPGSVVKPLILAAATSSRVYRIDEPIVCSGHLYPTKPTQLRCWIFKQFHTTHTAQIGRGLYGDDAIAVSCNIFFYTLAQRLGIERLVRWYSDFGIGTPFDLGIGEEYPGVVAATPAGQRLGESDAAMMGIGQGPVAWTPLHAADAYATIARGGLRLVPRILRDRTPRADELVIDPSVIDMCVKGLRASTQSEIGGGHHLNIAGGVREPIFSCLDRFDVIGKTGTAQAPTLFDEKRNEFDEPIVLRQGDHSWFVVMVGEKGGRPRYVIAVIMEYAGSGGRVSGPIANQIVYALAAEGYL